MLLSSYHRCRKTREILRLSSSVRRHFLKVRLGTRVTATYAIGAVLAFKTAALASIGITFIIKSISLDLVNVILTFIETKAMIAEVSCILEGRSVFLLASVPSVSLGRLRCHAHLYRPASLLLAMPF